MKAGRHIALVVVVLTAGPVVRAGWGNPCYTEVAVQDMFAKVSAIARCAYETFGTRDTSVWITGTQTLEPGNGTVSCTGYGYAGCETEVSPYAASTVYTSTGTFKGWQMGIEVDTITVVDSEKTPEARRPHSADDSEPCSGSSCSPIIIDVSGEGYRLTSTADGVAFDLRDEGRTRQTSWTARGAENAFLALDRNRNRRIDSGAELFGQATRLQSGARAEHGFAALADLDANDDGVIDARDPVWSALLLWTDRDHDGLSGVGELQRIADSGVTALSTHYQTIGKKDEWGNLFRYQSSIGAASRDRKYYDVLLQLER